MIIKNNTVVHEIFSYPMEPHATLNKTVTRNNHLRLCYAHASFSNINKILQLLYLIYVRQWHTFRTDSGYILHYQQNN